MATTAGLAAGGVGSLASLRVADWQLRNLGGVGAFVGSATPGPGGSVIAVGSAASLGDFFRPVNPFQTAYGGLSDAFILAMMPAGSEAVALNAASYTGPELAPGSLATAFYPGSSAAAEVRVGGQAATLFSSAAGHLSFVVPEGLEPGASELVLTSSGGSELAKGAVRIHQIAPAIFTANADGRGAPAAQLIRAARGGQTEQSPFDCSGGSGKCVPALVDASDAEGDSVLVLYGTGIRGRSAPAAVKAYFDGEAAAVDYAVPQPAYQDLYQMNIRLPEGLRGRGLVSLVVSVDGRTTNAVRLRIR